MLTAVSLDTDAHLTRARGSQPGPAARRRNARTALNQRTFILAYAAAGNVSAAAQVSGISRAVVYVWRARDSDFATAFADANERAVERLEFEARRRAVEGHEVPVFGSVGAGAGSGAVGSVRKYSDRLLMFLLQSAKPEKYAPRSVPADRPLEDVIAGAEALR